jgi:hypothetical protein
MRGITCSLAICLLAATSGMADDVPSLDKLDRKIL